MSTNISKQHREELLDKIRQIRSYIAAAPQDANTGNLLQYLDELTKDVKGKKYGLVFEQHREKIDEILATHTPVLTEQKDLFIDNGGEMNFLIEGDNLAALQLLEKTHKGNIDLIYIDPPYNRGLNKKNDFVYDDTFVDVNDTFRHSKWLSYIQKRLLLTHNLLSKTGVIFISIDQVEVMQLSQLCNEIFGYENLLGVITLVNNLKGRSDDAFFATCNEFMLVYAKDASSASIRPYEIDEEEIDNDYKYCDEKSYYKPTGFRKTGKGWQREARPYMYYPILFKNGSFESITDEEFSHIYDANKQSFDDEYVDSLIKQYQDKGYECYLPFDSNGNKGRWRWGFYDKYRKYLKTELCFNNANTICVKMRATLEDGSIRGKLAKTTWYKAEYDAGVAEKNLTKMFGEKVFENPKSIYQILDILKLQERPSNILDFFAGSGTTGHAVLKFNAEDGGHRRFILCTNNENNICRDVTYERLKTVITGKRKDGSEYGEQYNASLKYFKIDFVPISDKLYYEYADELLLHIRELVELENGINFNGNNDIAIVLTDEEMEQFVTQTANQTKVLYRGHDVLLTAEQEDYLNTKGIKVNVIPDYYYNELNR